MSRLHPGLVVLDKGLNLQTPKITAPEGSVLDTLNYEQVDFQGQKRIDGYTRYDGYPLSILNDYDILQVSGSIGLLDVEDILCTADTGIIGVVLTTDLIAEVQVAVLNPNLLPAIEESIPLYKLVAGAPSFIATATYLGKGKDSGITDVLHYNLLIQHNNVLRNAVGALPGAIAGLHWFNDRLYAVADMCFVAVNVTSAILPNDTIEIPDFGLTVVVADAVTYGNVSYVLLPLTTRLDTSLNSPVERDGNQIGNLMDTLPTWPPLPILASFFEAKSIQQTIDEEEPGYQSNAGWHFIHHGWQVNFDHGDSLFGSLPSLNQNIKNLGVQGPTSIAGDSGKAGTLTQKIAIAGSSPSEAGTDVPLQVNGWKSSNTHTSYQLEANNLEDIDTDYIYADAFISWNGDNDVISAPGITTPVLPQYSASAVVEVEII